MKGMNSLKNVVAAGLFAFGAVAMSFAYNAKELFGAKLYNELKTKGYVEKSFFGDENAKLSLYPKTALGEQAASSWPAGQDKPVFLVEELYLIPKEKLGSGEPTKTTIDYASKVIRSVSKMKGMQYYSHSSKKIKTLYAEAHFIAGPHDDTRVEDDVAGDADGLEKYCMLDDSSLGRANYRLEYRQRPDEVSGSFINMTSLKIGPLKALSPSNLRISLVITDCGDYMSVYLLTQAKVPKLSILEDSMYNSFSARLQAIYKWFCSMF